MSYKIFFQAAELFTTAVFAGCTNDDVVKPEGKIRAAHNARYFSDF